MNKIKCISVLSAAMLLLVAIVEFAVSRFVEGGMSRLYWVAPLFFWVFYLVAILLSNKKTNTSQFFLAFKGAKMFVTMVLAFALAFIIRSEAKGLIIYFLIYYMILLVAESVVLLAVRKKRV